MLGCRLSLLRAHWLGGLLGAGLCLHSGATHCGPAALGLSLLAPLSGALRCLALVILVHAVGIISAAAKHGDQTNGKPSHRESAAFCLLGRLCAHGRKGSKRINGG